MLPHHPLKETLIHTYVLIYYHTVLLALAKFVCKILWVKSCYNSKKKKFSYMKVLQVLKVPIFDFSNFVVLQVQQRSVRGKIFWHFVQTYHGSKSSVVSKRDLWLQTDYRTCVYKEIKVATIVSPLQYFSSRNYINWSFKYLLYVF